MTKIGRVEGTYNMGNKFIIQVELSGEMCNSLRLKVGDLIKVGKSPYTEVVGLNFNTDCFVDILMNIHLDVSSGDDVHIAPV